MTDEVNGSEKLKGFDKNALYRKETFADVNAGEIIVLVPVNSSNVRDPDRKQRFFSSIIATVRGAPNAIPFEIEVDTLEAAIDAWPERAAAVAEEFKAKMMDAALTRSLVAPSGARLTKPN